jgi:hypothetical protein
MLSGPVSLLLMFCVIWLISFKVGGFSSCWLFIVCSSGICKLTALSLFIVFLKQSFHCFNTSVCCMIMYSSVSLQNAGKLTCR